MSDVLYNSLFLSFSLLLSLLYFFTSLSLFFNLSSSLSLCLLYFLSLSLCFSSSLKLFLSLPLSLSISLSASPSISPSLSHPHPFSSYVFCDTRFLMIEAGSTKAAHANSFYRPNTTTRDNPISKKRPVPVLHVEPEDEVQTYI